MGWTTVFGPDGFNGTAFTALPTYNAAYAQDTANGTWRISSNGISAGCTVTSAARCYLVSAPAADQAVEYVIIGTLLKHEEGLTIRFTDGDSGNFWGGTGYVGYVEIDNQFHFVRLDGGGSHTELGAYAYTPASGDTIRIEFVGIQWVLIAAGATLAISTDATYASGTVGLWSGTSIDDSVSMSVDAFTAQTFAAATDGYLLVKN